MLIRAENILNKRFKGHRLTQINGTKTFFGIITRRFWGEERTRGIILQILLVFGLVLFFAFIISNTVTNLKNAGLASGYGFLGDTASFDINQRLIEYSSTSSYGRAIIVGGLNTIVVAIMGILAATLIGFLAGILRLSGNFLISRLITMYVEFVRNVPVLLQIIFWWW